METIKFKNVTKVIKKNKVLNNVSFEWDMTINHGIYGPNGSGKTMILRAISGLLKVDGEIEINNISDIGSKNFPESIGILIENPNFINSFTGFENLKLLSFMTDGVDDKQIVLSLSMVGLDPNDKKKVSKYSLGMKQRLGIAQAILGEPKIVLLDEPTNALDESAVELIENLIKNMKGTTFIITSHDKEFLKKVTEIQYYMNTGILKEEKL